MKHTLLSTASAIAFTTFIAMSSLPGAAFAMSLAPTVTKEEINAYVVANIKEPDKIAEAMKQFGVSLYDIQAATGYSRQDMVDYITWSNNPTLKAHLGQWAPDDNKVTGGKQGDPVTDAEIDAYIRANIKDPALIAAAMTKHNVGLDRIQSAMGFTRTDMANYIAQSGNIQLQSAMGSWHADIAGSTGGKVGDTVSGVDIDAYIIANINDPALIAAAMTKHNVTLDRIQRATGYTTEQMTNYINRSGNTTLQSALRLWTPASDIGVSDRDIDAYIKANINDPAKIAAAMKEHNVSLDRIQSAAGFTRAQMTDYIAQSNNSELKSAGASWTIAKDKSTGGTADTKIIGTDIDAYIRANLNDPALIAAAMEKHNIGLDRIQQATGYTRNDMIAYINASGNAALKEKLATWAEPGYRGKQDASINEYLRSILNDPNKIAEEMRKNDIGLDRIQQVSGYTREQMTDYINQSGNAYLKGLLANWKEPITIGLPAVGEIKQLANGYTIDSNGKLYAPGSKLAIAILTQDGTFLDVSGNKISDQLAQQYIALFKTTGGNTVADANSGAGGTRTGSGSSSGITTGGGSRTSYSQRNSYVAATDTGEMVAIDASGSVEDTQTSSKYFSGSVKGSLNVASVEELLASDAYKNASAADQTWMKNFVNTALTDSKATNAYADSGFSIRVGAHNTTGSGGGAANSGQGIYLANATVAQIDAALAAMPAFNLEAETQKAYAALKAAQPKPPSFSNPTAQQQTEWDAQLMARATVKAQEQHALYQQQITALNERKSSLTQAAHTEQMSAHQTNINTLRDSTAERVKQQAIAMGLTPAQYGPIVERAHEDFNNALTKAMNEGKTLSGTIATPTADLILLQVRDAATKR